MEKTERNQLIDKTVKDFYQHLMSLSDDHDFLAKVDEGYKSFENKLECSFCGKDITEKFIVKAVAVSKCDHCKVYTEVPIDKIPESMYTACNFLHENKIVDILAAQGVNVY